MGEGPRWVEKFAGMTDYERRDLMGKGRLVLSPGGHV